jgi:hypothetical protein
MCLFGGLENLVGLKLRIYEVEPGRVERHLQPRTLSKVTQACYMAWIIATIIDEISGGH